MSDNPLDRFINPDYTYRFEQGPGTVCTEADAYSLGLNCVTLAHLTLKHLYGITLPPNLDCYEMFTDTQYFEPVETTTDARRGDLIWFGLEHSPQQFRNFLPRYDAGGHLVNWRAFPLRHVGVIYNPNIEDPLILHASQVEGTNVIWPLSKFKNYKQYRNVFGISRIKNGADERTRTSTSISSLRPERSASTNSATSANYFQVHSIVTRSSRIAQF